MKSLAEQLYPLWFCTHKYEIKTLDIKTAIRQPLTCVTVQLTMTIELIIQISAKNAGS